MLRVGWRNFFALTHRRTDGRTDRLTDRETNTLASRGLEESAHALRGLFLINTLLLYPSLSPYSQTDGQTDRLTDRETNTLASRGLEEHAHASRGLEEPFFQLCCCVSFWFWREIGFGCTYYYVLGVPYSCGVVLVFLVLARNSFWCYLRTYFTIQLCGCVIFLVVVGKLILFEYLTVTIVSQKISRTFFVNKMIP
jgi:hypothetical protein